MPNLTKPANVENDPWRSNKWDEIVAGRNFTQADIPTLALLVSWYQVVEQCMDDVSHVGGGVQVAYQNDMGDIKALPQLSVMKQASGEIRAINKQLGIDDTVQPEKKDSEKASVLSLVISERKKKAK